MKRNELEHDLRAAGSLADETDFIVIGSQAILGSAPDAPQSLVSSVVDLYPRSNPELSKLIEGTIGENSPFHENFGYYGHGVGPTTATLPEGWQQRLTPFSNANTRGVIGWCLSPEDIAYSKLAAGRQKDMDYVGELLASNLVTAERVRELRLSSETDQLVQSRLQTAQTL